MAQNVTVVLVDDIDQSEAAETVHFGVDGTAYEIDLSARHASELRSMLGRYISAARRAGQAPARARQQRRSRPRTQMDREQSRRIRSWAMERGLLASPRGRIPRHVADEYQAAMQVSPSPGQVAGRSWATARLPRQPHEAGEPKPCASWYGCGRQEGGVGAWRAQGASMMYS